MSAPGIDPVSFSDHGRLLTAARLVQAVRPCNWDDDEDPDQVAAWSALEVALQPLAGAGDTGSAHWSASAEGWGVVAVFAAGLIGGLLFGLVFL